MGFPNIGPGELILILIIALIVLGPGKLPDVASSLGKSVREFRKAATDVTEAGRIDAPPAASPTATTQANTPVESQPASQASATPAQPEGRDRTASAGGEPARDPNLS
jgi:sec-independent protein translocase protein TatA